MRGDLEISPMWRRMVRAPSTSAIGRSSGKSPATPRSNTFRRIRGGEIDIRGGEIGIRGGVVIINGGAAVD